MKKVPHSDTVRHRPKQGQENGQAEKEGFEPSRRF